MTIFLLPFFLAVFSLLIVYTFISSLPFVFHQNTVQYDPMYCSLKTLLEFLSAHFDERGEKDAEHTTQYEHISRCTIKIHKICIISSVKFHWFFVGFFVCFTSSFSFIQNILAINFKFFYSQRKERTLLNSHQATSNTARRKIKIIPFFGSRKCKLRQEYRVDLME